MPIHYLLDADDTLVLTNKTKDGHPIYNDALIDQLIALGITHISILSAMMSLDPKMPNRTALVSYLKARGITVDHVIYPYDLDFSTSQKTQTVGISYAKFLKPIEEIAVQFASNNITSEVFNPYKIYNDTNDTALMIQFLIDEGLFKPEDTLESILQDLAQNKSNGLNKIQQYLYDKYSTETEPDFAFNLLSLDNLCPILSGAKRDGISTLQDLLDKQKTRVRDQQQSAQNYKPTPQQTSLLQEYFHRANYFMCVWYLSTMRKSGRGSDKGDAYAVYAYPLTLNDQVVFIDENQGHHARLDKVHNNRTFTNQLACLRPVQPAAIPRDQDNYVSADDFLNNMESVYNGHYTKLLQNLNAYKMDQRYKGKTFRSQTFTQLIDNIATSAAAIQESASPKETAQLCNTLAKVNVALLEPSPANLAACRSAAARAQGHSNPLWQALGVVIMVFGAALAVLGVLVITGTVGVAALPSMGLITAGISAAQIGTGIAIGGGTVFVGGGALALYGRQKGFSKAITTLADSLAAEELPKLPEKQSLLAPA